MVRLPANLDVLMKKSVAFLAVLAAACSSKGPTPDQQRIAQLEQEKAQVETQLKEARTNITKLQAALGRSGSSDDTVEEPSGPVQPQPFNPTPQDAGGGQAAVQSGSGGGAPQGKE